MLICLPSRGRPGNIERLISCWQPTRAEAEVWLRCDEDDPDLPKYRALKLPDGWELVVGKQARAAAAMRELFAARPDAKSYLQLGDDTVPRTYRWDRKLEDAALISGMSYPDDGIHGRSKITHPVPSGDLLRALGFWTLPGLTHLYVDTVIEHVGRMLNCVTYCGDVLLDHLHFSTGKSPYDATYVRVDNGADAACYREWMAAPATAQLLARIRSIVR